MSTIVNIATTGNRPEQLRKTIQSLMEQCDRINVYNNSNAPDLTDMGKFHYLQNLSHDCYYLTADDDIIYPPDYVTILKKWIDHFRCPVSFHGRIINPNIPRYYASGHRVFDFRAGLMVSKYVDVIGTGVMGFRTDHYKPDLNLTEYKRMSDLVFSLQAKKDNVKLVVAEHSAQWLTQQVVDDSIMKSEMAGSQVNQIKLMNELCRL